ncbi:hypothetical protein [Bradyrhizobium sp. LA7.1]|uniref:hypothetical protein n=1 Tax=Bradyrhizobium sp. LA7.1 TaxID=3156324 RepID=UPI00339284C2
MLSSFQAGYRLPALAKFFDRALFETQTFSSQPGIRAATPNSLISGHANSFSTSSARFGRSPPRHTKHNA